MDTDGLNGQGWTAFHVMHQYIVETEATIVELDGEMWTIVMLSTNYGTRKVRRLVSEEVWRLLDEHDRLVTGVRKEDGTLGIAVLPELREKLQARMQPNQKWWKVRLYPREEAVSALGKHR